MRTPPLQAPRPRACNRQGPGPHAPRGDASLGRRAAPAEVAGGDPAHNAAITRGVLAGDKGACRDVVVLNAAAALVAAGKTDTIEAGMRVATESIDSGAAHDKLQKLVRFTNQNG